MSCTACLKQRDSIYCCLFPFLCVFSVCLSHSLIILLFHIVYELVPLALFPSLSFCSFDFLCLHSAIHLYFRLYFTQCQFFSVSVYRSLVSILNLSKLIHSHIYCLIIRTAHPCQFISNCHHTAFIYMLLSNVFKLVSFICFCLVNVQSLEVFLFRHTQIK